MDCIFELWRAISKYFTIPWTILGVKKMELNPLYCIVVRVEGEIGGRWQKVNRLIFQ